MTNYVEYTPDFIKFLSDMGFEHDFQPFFERQDGVNMTVIVYVADKLYFLIESRNLYENNGYVLTPDEFKEKNKTFLISLKFGL